MRGTVTESGFLQAPPTPPPPVGDLRAVAGTAQIAVTDSIVDRRNGAAIAGLTHPTSPPGGFVSGAAKTVQLERVTVFGQIWCEILKASESLLDQIAVVDDQQSG